MFFFSDGVNADMTWLPGIWRRSMTGHDGFQEAVWPHIVSSAYCAIDEAAVSTGLGWAHTATHMKYVDISSNEELIYGRHGVVERVTRSSNHRAGRATPPEVPFAAALVPLFGAGDCRVGGLALLRSYGDDRCNHAKKRGCKGLAALWRSRPWYLCTAERALNHALKPNFERALK